jgi:hypothetical protein
VDSEENEGRDFERKSPPSRLFNPLEMPVNPKKLSLPCLFGFKEVKMLPAMGGATMPRAVV